MDQTSIAQAEVPHEDTGLKGARPRRSLCHVMVPSLVSASVFASLVDLYGYKHLSAYRKLELVMKVELVESV